MKNMFRLLMIALAIAMSATAFADDTKASETKEPAKVEAAKTTDFSSEQVRQIQQIIRDYLIKNPQILVEVSQSLQQQQEKQAQNAAMQGIRENKAALFNDPNSPVHGDKNAKVTVVEFFDYQCGHCREMAPLVQKIIDSNKNVRVVYKELPIFGGMSKYAAQAALAAMKQDKYVEFHNLLLTAEGPLTKESIMELAKKAGLNIEKLNKDMDSADIEKQIQENFQLARALKIIGTPTFVITNEKQTEFHYIPGATSFDDLQKQIQSLE